MRRCQHSVYIGVHDKRALYCAFCTPDGPKKTRDVRLPKSGLGHPEKLHANGTHGACPKCGSEIWTETKKVNERECAECGALYRRMVLDVKHTVAF